MPLNGADLGVELEGLRHAGRIGLPRIAEIFLDANHRLAGTDDIDGAFRRSYGGQYVGGPSSGAVAGPWTALRDTVQTILGNTATNVVMAGQILCHIADTYETCDTEAGDALRREWAKVDTDLFVNQPPAELPEPIMPEP
jgi:hypothetical protein